MSKMTLLEIVQDILNDLDSDPVNSITDTVESLQVAQIVKTTYHSIVDGKHFSWLYELFTFEGLASTSKPNYLKIPDTIVDTEWVKYNTRKVTDTKSMFTFIEYMEPQMFLEMLDKRDSSSTNIQSVVDFSGVTLLILNNKAPQYFTSFDDNYIVFDSFDSAIDSTVQASKTSGWGRRATTFTISDTFIPDLPVQMFSYLLSEAKSMAFSVNKQSLNAKVEQVAKTQRYRMSQDAWKLQKGIQYPDYGRR